MVVSMVASIGCCLVTIGNDKLMHLCSCQPKGTLPKPPEDVLVVVPFDPSITVGKMTVSLELQPG